MKRFYLIFLLLLCCKIMSAQHLHFQHSPITDSVSTVTLYERISRLEAKTDKLNVSLNTQMSFNFYPYTDTTQGVFKMDQIRLEITGHLTDKIYYRYRQQLNKSNTAQNLDNMPYAIDYAAVGYHFSERLSLFAGKQTSAYGGFEYEKSPLEVYQYCDYLNYMTSSMMGVNASYWITKNNELQVQILESRNTTFEEFFGEVPGNVKPAKTPLSYTINWNSSLWQNKIRTRWSASFVHDATDKSMYYIALGTKYNHKKFHVFYDLMYSIEQIDRKGIISRIGQLDDYQMRALDVQYISMILFGNYRLSPSWNFVLKGIYETARVTKANNDYAKGLYYRHPAFEIGAEYYPTGDNLHIFVLFSADNYLYESPAKDFGARNNHPRRIAMGFVYRIPVF